MTLETQLVDLPPLAGTSEDGGKYVPTQGLHEADNFVFSRTAELVKRAGYGLLPGAQVSGDTVPLPDRVMVRGDEVLAVGNEIELPTPGPTLYSWSPQLDTWIPRGPVSGLSVTRRRVLARPSNDGVTDAPQIAHLASLECALYRADNLAYVRITDRVTGAVVANHELTSVTGLNKVVLLVTGNTWRFVWLDSFSLRTFVINPASPTELGTSTLVGTLDTLSLYWDAVATLSGSWVFARVRTGGTGVDLIGVTGSVPATSAAITGLSASKRCALAFRGSTVLVVYDSSTGPPAGGVYARTYTTSLGPGVGPWVALSSVYYDLLFALACAVAPDGTLMVATTTETRSDAIAGGDFNAFNPPYRTHFKPFLSDGTPVNTTPIVGERGEFMWHVALGSRPFAVGQVLYCLVHSRPDASEVDLSGLGTTDESRRFGYAIVNLTRGRDDWNAVTKPILVEGVLAPTDGRGLDMSAIGIHLTLPPTESDVVPMPIVVYRGGDDVTNGRTAVADVVDVSDAAGAEALGTSVSALNLLVQGGAWPSLYDGRSAVEAAFLQPPGCFLWTRDDGPGPAVPPTGANVYTYYFLYRWRDERGHLHLSRRSNPLTVELAQAGGLPVDGVTVTLSIATTALSRCQANSDVRDVEIVVYRTKANQPGTHYEVRSKTGTYPLVNTGYFALVEFVDDNSDDDLTAPYLGIRPQLYTDGGILDNDIPPPFRHLALHGGRLWGVSSEKREVWFTRYLIEGEAPAWSIVNRVTLDDSDSEPVATAGQDGAALLFTRTQVYVVGGQGPNDTGTPPFNPPDRLQVARGCLDARSVVSFRNGTAFDAPEGLVMLSRRLELVPLGRPVERTVADSREFGPCRGALHDPARDRITWLYLGDVGTRAAVYDVALDAWTTWTWAGQRVLSHVLWRGRHVLAHEEGVALEVYGDRPGYDPDTRWITSTLTTPWLRVGALGGFQRLTRLHLQLEANSSHGLTFFLRVDGRDVPVQIETWTPAQLAAMPTFPREPLVISVGPQKSATFQLRLTDSPPDMSTGNSPAGFTYHGASLRLGVKKGQWKGPLANQR